MRLDTLMRRLMQRSSLPTRLWAASVEPAEIEEVAQRLGGGVKVTAGAVRRRPPRGLRSSAATSSPWMPLSAAAW
jgi:hypothetical protein